MSLSTRDFLARAMLAREMVDRFLDLCDPNWAVFDDELGQKPRGSVVKDRLDANYTIWIRTGDRCWGDPS